MNSPESSAFSLPFTGMTQLARPARSSHQRPGLGVSRDDGDNLLKIVVGQAAPLGLRNKRSRLDYALHEELYGNAVYFARDHTAMPSSAKPRKPVA
jgi:hypothetical protein